MILTNKRKCPACKASLIKWGSSEIWKCCSKFIEHHAYKNWENVSHYYMNLFTREEVILFDSARVAMSDNFLHIQDLTSANSENKQVFDNAEDIKAANLDSLGKIEVFCNNYILIK